MEPKTDSLNVDEIKEALASIDENTSREELWRKIDFFVKQLNQSYEINRKNVLVLTEALEQAQTKYKQYESERGNFKSRAKLFIKKVLIAWGWYEASYDELKEIHSAKTGIAISEKS
jgi:hypothetical protein